MEKVFKLAQQFDESLRNYWVGRMQQSLAQLRVELEPWKVHPKLLEALKGLSRNGDPDGLWGNDTNKALYFFNLAVDWSKKDQTQIHNSNPPKTFAEHFAIAEQVKPGQIDQSTGYVKDNALAKDNTRKIDLYRGLLSDLAPPS
jgi:hypothetical protein